VQRTSAGLCPHFRGVCSEGGFGVWWFFLPIPALAANACRSAAIQSIERQEYMITAKGGDTRYFTTFTNGKHEAFSDNTAEKGGQGAGFRPHELLEAALACCINMWLRIYADNHGLQLDEVITKVWVKRDKSEETEFEYSIELYGALTDEQRSKLMRIAETCPVRQSLSRKLSIHPVLASGENQVG
jgi:putative redox protein